MLGPVDVFSLEFLSERNVLPFNVLRSGVDLDVNLSRFGFLEGLGDGSDFDELSGEPGVSLLSQVLVEVFGFSDGPFSQKLFREFDSRISKSEESEESEDEEIQLHLDLVKIK